MSLLGVMLIPELGLKICAQLDYTDIESCRLVCQDLKGFVDTVVVRDPVNRKRLNTVYCHQAWMSQIHPRVHEIPYEFDLRPDDIHDVREIFTTQDHFILYLKVLARTQNIQPHNDVHSILIFHQQGEFVDSFNLPDAPWYIGATSDFFIATFGFDEVTGMVIDFPNVEEHRIQMVTDSPILTLKAFPDHITWVTGDRRSSSYIIHTCKTIEDIAHPTICQISVMSSRWTRDCFVTSTSFVLSYLCNHRLVVYDIITQCWVDDAIHDPHSLNIVVGCPRVLMSDAYFVVLPAESYSVTPDIYSMDSGERLELLEEPNEDPIPSCKLPNLLPNYALSDTYLVIYNYELDTVIITVCDLVQETVRTFAKAEFGRIQAVQVVLEKFLVVIIDNLSRWWSWCGECHIFDLEEKDPFQFWNSHKLFHKAIAWDQKDIFKILNDFSFVRKPQQRSKTSVDLIRFRPKGFMK